MNGEYIIITFGTHWWPLRSATSRPDGKKEIQVNEVTTENTIMLSPMAKLAKTGDWYCVTETEKNDNYTGTFFVEDARPNIMAHTFRPFLKAGQILAFVTLVIFSMMINSCSSSGSDDSVGLWITLFIICAGAAIACLIYKRTECVLLIGPDRRRVPIDANVIANLTAFLERNK